MRRVNWTITEGQHQSLKQLSRATGLSISELVRRALDHFFREVERDREGPPLPIERKEQHHER